jgi:hypothetical protein
MSHSPCTPPLALSPRWRTQPQPVPDETLFIWFKLSLIHGPWFKLILFFEIFGLTVFSFALTFLEAAPILLVAAWIRSEFFKSRLIGLVESLFGETSPASNLLWIFLLLSHAETWFRLLFTFLNHFWKAALVEVFLDSFLPVRTILLGRFWKVFVSQRQFRKTSNSLWVSFPRRQNIHEPKSSLTDHHKDLVSLRDVGHSANRVQKQCSFFSLGKCVLPSTFASRWKWLWLRCRTPFALNR